MHPLLLVIVAVAGLMPAGQIVVCGDNEDLLIYDRLAPFSDTPESAVRGMFGAFSGRSPDGYAGWMTDDFTFTSNDSDFVATYPNGMSREDERRFARNLLQPPDLTTAAPDRPYAVNVIMSVGEIGTLEPPADDRATVVLNDMRVCLAMSDSSTLDLGGASHAIEVVRLAQGWRVRRWIEFRPGTEMVASRDLGRKPQPTGIDPALVLAIARRVDRAGGKLSFDVSLPEAGGHLELFDVMGRRVDARDLSDLPRGRHQVTLNGASRAAGVYWARLRQRDAAVTTRVVWIR